jgi:hypothetical protein
VPRETDSGREPFVAVMAAADVASRYDPTGANRVDGAGLRRLLGEREVRSRAVVVHDVGARHPAEMPLGEEDDVSETRAADRPDDAFDVELREMRSPTSRSPSSRALSAGVRIPVRSRVVPRIHAPTLVCSPKSGKESARLAVSGVRRRVLAAELAGWQGRNSQLHGHGGVRGPSTEMPCGMTLEIRYE